MVGGGVSVYNQSGKLETTQNTQGRMSQSHAISVGVLTVSDRVFKGINEDASGPLAAEIIEKNLSGAKAPPFPTMDYQSVDLRLDFTNYLPPHLHLLLVVCEHTFLGGKPGGSACSGGRRDSRYPGSAQGVGR